MSDLSDWMSRYYEAKTNRPMLAFATVCKFVAIVAAVIVLDHFGFETTAKWLSVAAVIRAF